MCSFQCPAELTAGPAPYGAGRAAVVRTGRAARGVAPAPALLNDPIIPGGPASRKRRMC